MGTCCFAHLAPELFVVEQQVKPLYEWSRATPCHQEARHTVVIVELDEVGRLIKLVDHQNDIQREYNYIYHETENYLTKSTVKPASVTMCHGCATSLR